MHPTVPTPQAIREAGRRLAAGGLVAFPTETVYGLGADATSPEAVARIYAAKGRPRFNPLIAHVATAAEAGREGEFTREAGRLAQAFWPGPLTLVLPRSAGGGVCDLACAGLRSVALRVPANPIALALIAAAGRPVAAPSANPSGRLSPTRAGDVAAEMVAGLDAAIDLILDGGACPVGVESTIIGCLDGAVLLLRPGGLGRDAIEAVLGRRLDEAGGPGQARGDGVSAPGQLASHYAPRAALRLDARSLRPGEAGLDFAAQLTGATLDLSPAGDLTEAAANLFRHLRDLDGAGGAHRPGCIAVAPVPEQGLGAAINDRLRRAAAPRPS